MKPADIKKWLDELDLSEICSGTQFVALLPPDDFWRYVEEGGSIREPFETDNHGRQIELKLQPVYDPEVIKFFRVSSHNLRLMCQHNFNTFNRAYKEHGGSFDF